MYKFNNSIILMDIHSIKHNKYYCRNANAIKHFGIVVNICTFILHSFQILPVVEGPGGRVARIGGYGELFFVQGGGWLHIYVCEGGVGVFVCCR